MTRRTLLKIMAALVVTPLALVKWRPARKRANTYVIGGGDGKKHLLVWGWSEGVEHSTHPSANEWGILKGRARFLG